MILLGDVESISWNFVGFVSFIELNILIQLVVHSFIEEGVINLVVD
jgi:hypothetical protein